MPESDKPVPKWKRFEKTIHEMHQQLAPGQAQS
jgi:hypothetical protein